MNKSLQHSLMLAPLIGATGSLINALGLWLMFVLVVSAFGLASNLLRARLVPNTWRVVCVLIAATLTSCAELAAQAWWLPWHQHVGVYAGLIGLQCVVLEHSGFFQTRWRDRLRLCLLFGGLMFSVSLLRQLLGSVELGLALLAPGGFILLGLLLAAWQAWQRPAAPIDRFEEIHRP